MSDRPTLKEVLDDIAPPRDGAWPDCTCSDCEYSRAIDRVRRAKVAPYLPGEPPGFRIPEEEEAPRVSEVTTGTHSSGEARVTWQ